MSVLNGATYRIDAFLGPSLGTTHQCGTWHQSPIWHYYGLLETTLPAGVKAKLPRIPLEMGDYDFALRRNPPQIGEDTADLLTELGYSEDEISALVGEGVVAVEG